MRTNLLHLTFLVAATILSPIPLFGKYSGILAPGAKLEQLAGGFGFTEGPTSDGEGNVFFTDQPNNRIMKWSVVGELTEFLKPSGRANGMCFDFKGNLIACADENSQLWSITSDGKATIIFKDFEGKRLNGPNDVWVRPDGGLYFTDPFYARPWWTHQEKPQDSEQVYFVSADYKTITRVTKDLLKPNGIVGTPDGKVLYIADIGAGKTYRYRIAEDGSLTEKELACLAGSDGMTIDKDGNLYLTGNGVTIFDKTGKKIEHIEVKDWTANVCFGGKNKQTLFITASNTFYSIRTRMTGANAAK